MCVLLMSVQSMFLDCVCVVGVNFILSLFASLNVSFLCYVFDCFIYMYVCGFDWPLNTRNIFPHGLFHHVVNLK